MIQVRVYLEIVLLFFKVIIENLKLSTDLNLLVKYLTYR